MPCPLAAQTPDGLSSCTVLGPFWFERPPVHAGGFFGNYNRSRLLADGHPAEFAIVRDQDFLLYPLDTGEDPVCLSCAAIMTVAVHEAREIKPDFIAFRCPNCGRSEKFLCEG